MEGYQSQRKHCIAVRPSVDPERRNMDLHCTCTHGWITLRDSNNCTFKFTFLRVTAVDNLTSFFLTS